MRCGHKQFHCFLYQRIKILLSYTYNFQPNIESKLHFYDIQNFRIVLPYLSPEVAILPSTVIYPQRLFCCELFVIGQS